MNFDLIIHGGQVVSTQGISPWDIGVCSGKISALGDLSEAVCAERINAEGNVILPGLVDPHCHFREPGPEEEEDFSTGTRAAAAGGVTMVLEQPVDTPPTTTVKRFEEKLAGVSQKSYVDFGLWGGVVPDNLDDLEHLAASGACAFKAFIVSSDPSYPMIDDGVLLMAMERVKATGKLLAIHCENQAIINHYTERLKKLDSVAPIEHARSRPEVSELEAIQRVILFAKETGVRLHVLHLSAGRGVEMVAAAKSQGVSVSVETCPHYLVLTEEDLNRYGPYAKCNPPLRDENNQALLWQEMLAGRIDCLVSDHSPYTSADKARGLDDIRLAPPGIAAVELGLPLMVSEGVNKKKITFSQLARLMSENPAKLFGIYPQKGWIGVGADADFAWVDPTAEWVVDARILHTKNKWSPYDGWQIKGKVTATMVRGKMVYRDGGYFPKGPGYGIFLPGK
jgi:allantoinase